MPCLYSKDALELTSAQMGMWLANEVSLNPGNNNISEYMIIDGAMDSELFKTAIRKMISEAESMHSRFLYFNNAVKQRLDVVDDYDAGFYDFSSMPDPWADAEVCIKTIFNKNYPLPDGKAFDFFLIKLSEEKYVYCHCCHHILLDGFGAFLILKRTIEIYNCLVSGKPVPSTPFGSFKTLIKDDYDYRVSNRFSRDRQYWMSRFSDMPEPVSLAGRSAPSKSITRQRINISKTVDELLRKKAKELGHTLPQLLTALNCIYLYRMTGHEDLVIGLPVTARVGREQRSIPGLMSNIMPLRLSLAPNVSLIDVLKLTAKEMMATLRHQQYRNDDLLRDLSLTHPLFNTTINVELFGEDLTFNGAKTLTTNVGSGPVADLNVFFFGYGEEHTLVLGFDANSDLYDREQLLAHHDRMLALFAALLEQPEGSIGLPSLLNERELKEFVEINDKTCREIPSLTLPELFEAQVRRTPEAPALYQDNRVMTYSKLNGQINQLCHYLIEQGVLPGKVVAVLLPRSENLVIALLAIAKVGATYLPLDPEHPAERLKHILATAEPALILTSSDTSVLVRGFCQHQIDDGNILASIVAQPEHNPYSAMPQPSQAAYVLFTSGSTGAPKGVLISHHALANFLAAMQQCVQMSTTHRMLAVTTIGFDIAALEVFLPLVNGASVVMVSRDVARDPDLLAEEIIQKGVTHLQGTPALWQGLVEYQPQAIANLTALVGGDSLPANLAESMVTLALRVIQVYGPTETTIWSTLCELTPAQECSSSIGLPILNTQVYILDSALQPVPVGQPGELYIAGDGLALGYLKRADLTSERFIANPFSSAGLRMYRTGDMAYWGQDMRIYFLGRVDNQVKIRGYRIELGDIENALLQSPTIKHALVSVHEEKISGQKRLIAYVIAHEGEIFSQDELRIELAKQLPDYMVPAVIMLLDSYPLTANGKIDRRALPVPEFTLQAPVLPTNSREEELCQLFAECLDISPPGIHDNFFSLGGHSLLALQLLSRLRAVFNVELPLKAIFDSPTVAELAAVLDSTKVQALRPKLVAQPRPTLLPMSFAQQRLWLQEQITPSSAYNMPLIVRFNGKLNAAALAEALSDVVVRHESLRTLLIQQDDIAYQHIIPAEQVRFTLQTQNIAASLLTERLTQQCGHIFSLDKEIPIKAWLYQLTPERHVLLLLIHHTAGDGGSLPPLLHDLGQAYRARLTKEAPDMPPLAVQYADYALWQRDLLSGGQGSGSLYEQQMHYWHNQLANLPEDVTLPGDRSRPLSPSYAGDRVEFAISAQVYQRLKILGSQTRTSLFMLLQTALAVLLHRMGLGDDIVIGTPVFGRTEEAQLPLIGFFANTVVLRMDLSGDPELTTLIEQARTVVLAANEHQDVPFERIVEELAPNRSLAKHPLFQIMIALDNAWPSSIEFPQLHLEQQDLPTKAAKFDLLFNFQLDERQDLLTGYIEFSTDLYDTDTVVGFVEYLTKIIDSMAANPKIRVCQLELLSATQQHKLLNICNATSVEIPKLSLAELFEQQVTRSPEAIAVSDGNKTITYAQLNRAANRLAHRLYELAGAETFCAGLLMAHSIEEVISILAVIKAGGTYLPLRLSDPQERQQMMLDDMGATLLITDPEQHFPEVLHVIRDVAQTYEQSFPETNLGIRVASGSLAYVMYTSGSTGKPKGIAVSQESVIALACDRQWLPADHQRVLLHSPAAFDASTYELWVTLLCGGQLVVAPQGELDIDAMAQTIVNQKVTALFLTTGLFRLMAEEKASALADVRLLLTGGEILPKAAVGAIMKQCPKLAMLHVYGPTETTTFATSYPMHGVPAGVSSPIGSPFDNTQVYVLDTYLKPVPVGIPGELYIAGIGLARGYLNQPGLTAEHFVANPFSDNGERMYRSGDWVRWRQDGVLEYLNRGDQQVKVRGFRIELAEVEAALQKQDGVAQAFVCLFEPQKGNKQLAAYVIAERDRQCEPTQLRQAMSTCLPNFMVPAFIHVVDSFPLTANGKVDVRSLPIAVFDVEQGRSARNERERMLCSLFADLLGLTEVSIDDDFFALGGHSLMASRLISQIRKALNVDPSIRDLFEAPTVAQFTERLGSGNALRPVLQDMPKPERLPLSAAQRRLWMVGRIEDGKFTYNMPLTLELKGELNVPAIAAALNDVIARHESLRTRFQELPDGSVYQRIMTGEEAHCVLTLQGIQPDRLQDEVRITSEYLFDLANENPCRAWLFQVEAQRYVLLFLMHHIASDGASLMPLLGDLSEAYNARSQGQAPAWAPLPVQYADYALWQDKLLGAAKDPHSLQHRQLAYWREVLQDLPEELPLPFDRLRPQRSSYQGKQWQFEVEPVVYSRLLSVARQQNASLFMVLQAALAVMLSRLGAGTDIPLGTVIAGRTDEALEPLIGFFTNTLVLRTDVSGNPTFEQLLERVRERALQAYEHQDLPFENLVEALNPERSLARHPLFQVMLVLQNNAHSGFQFNGLDTQAAAPLLPVAKFDLTFNLQETPTALKGIVEYATDLFDEATAERLAGYFMHILQGISNNSRCLISELELLSSRERSQIVNDWNNTVRTLPVRTFAEQFEAIALAAPDALALVGENEQLTYGQLNQRANRLANLMMVKGVGAENVIAIALPRSVELIVALVATLKTGAAYLPLDPDYPAERLNYMLEHAQPALVVTNAVFAEKLATQYVSLQLDNPVLQTQLAQHSADHITLPRQLNIDNAAYIIYTSGSTGLPKGVLVTHRGISHLVASMVERLHVTPQSRVLQFASPSFDASFWDISMGLLSGASLLVADRDALSPGEPLYALMHKQGVTHATLPPVGLAVMPRKPLPLLETLVVAGEACQPELIEFWGQGRRMINAYGPSESTVCATMSQPLQAGSTPPIGSPIINIQTYVLDERLQPVAPGVKGELYIAGESLARGYVQRPDLTAERFVANPFGTPGSRMYRTGDMACWQADGELMFMGRVDHQVKIRGFRIELGEIESQLLKHPQLNQASVIVREDKPGLRQLVGYAVATEAGVDTLQVREYLRNYLPEYMVPVAIVLLPSIPVTPNGKVDRRALPLPTFLPSSKREPRNEQEQLLCTLFAELLGVEQVDIDGNFFEMGGDSITAIQLVARTRQLGWVLTPRQIFEHKTVAELVKVMQADSVTIAYAQVDAIGELPATPIIHWLMDNPGNINEFSQAALLQTPELLDEAQLRQMLALLLEQHDVLRLVAQRSALGECQLIIPPVASDAVDNVLRIVDCQAWTTEDIRQCIKVESQRAKQRLDPGAGKMVQAVWFRTSPGYPGRLMLVLHHLVVDGVSWRLLVSDLQNLWANLSVGKAPSLLPAGTTFRSWAHRLQQEADARSGELEHWRAVLAAPDALLTSRPIDKQKDVVSASDSLRAELATAFTQPLLGTIPTLFHAGINDVLLCAFTLAINDWRQGTQTDVLLDLEGHGREELPGTELSRTLGWFTSMYPVRLDPGATQIADPYALGNALKRIKEQLRQVPANGLGYGLLRYLNTQTRPILSHLQQAQVGFNYLGRMVAGGNSDWQAVEEARLLDPVPDANFALPHGLSLNAIVEERPTGPVLVANWSWASALYSETSIGELGNHWFRWLTALSQLSSVPDAGGFTPSDITMVDFKQDGLAKLQAKWKKRK
ncbi:Surfactin synthase subunit 1 [Serratia fonticola]|uniref:non-ribosomal peptide synthetase n=1 Tax=Serratia fonticola TaxID=47917 RepID=UPI0021840837|nr:non-ribosomal peptide synthetase [Serratia fonticola]CAI2510144.1 Surfactin synthase subunit 1 [Serratia fonticola]